MKKKIFLLILITSFFIPSLLSARTNWGLGLIVGAPTVLLHVAIPAGEYLGVDVDLGWSAWDVTNMQANGSTIYGIVDIIAWNPELGTPKARFATGLGVALGYWMQKIIYPDNGFFVGMRIPLAFEWIPNKNFEGFIKLGPGVIIYPHAAFRMDIGIGGRYIFN